MVKWPEGQIIVEVRGGEGQTRTKARALLVYAGHEPSSVSTLQLAPPLGSQAEAKL